MMSSGAVNFKMADGNEEDIKGLEEEKLSKKIDSNQDISHPSRPMEKAQVSSTYSSPVNYKRRFEQGSQGEKFGKRTKYSCKNSGEGSVECQKSSKTKNEEKRDLVKILRKKEEILRKLNLVKMYRAKNNLSDLENLISKWRSISQTAAQDLFEKFSQDKVITMGQFLDAMRISHDLIKYCEEDETFD